LKTDSNYPFVTTVTGGKCEWRNAPSIQRYFFSLKPDLLLARFPGARTGRAPKEFSAIGPNCRLINRDYSRGKDTE
jgi:hypothetical protein